MQQQYSLEKHVHYLSDSSTSKTKKACLKSDRDVAVSAMQNNLNNHWQWSMFDGVADIVATKNKAYCLTKNGAILLFNPEEENPIYYTSVTTTSKLLPKGDFRVAYTEDELWIEAIGGLRPLEQKGKIKAQVITVVFLKKGKRLVTLEHHGQTVKLNLYRVSRKKCTFTLKDTVYVILQGREERWKKRASESPVYEKCTYLLNTGTDQETVYLMQYFRDKAIFDNYRLEKNKLILCNAAEFSPQEYLIPLHAHANSKFVKYHLQKHTLEMMVLEPIYDKIREKQEIKQDFIPRSIVSINEHAIVGVVPSGNVVMYETTTQAIKNFGAIPVKGIIEHVKLSYVGKNLYMYWIVVSIENLTNVYCQPIALE